MELMNWYLPITILPGLGMLILSTVNQMMNLSQEIGRILSDECDAFALDIAQRKIKQLGLVTRAVVLLYVATGSYVLSGIFGVILDNNNAFGAPSVALYLGTIFIFIAITLLITYAFRAVSIRRHQFDHNLKPQRFNHGGSSNS